MLARPLIVALAFAVSLSPAALASWSAFGSAEPDSSFDRTSPWNAKMPDTSPTGKSVYLNGFLGQYPLTAINPNAGTVESGFTATPFKHFALFGVWRDCNKDGFVGLGDNGLFEYRSELLFGDTSVCSVVAVPQPVPQDWYPSHNDGQWVHEFLPIMWEAYNNANQVRDDQDVWDINDNATRVWVDELAPGEVPAGSGCWINQQPRETYQSTGGLVEWVDCHSGWRATDNANAVGQTLGVNQLGLGQVTYSDKPRDQSESTGLLNVANPWGHQDDAAYAQVWDCGQDQIEIRESRTLYHDESGVIGDINTTTRLNVSMPGEPRDLDASGSPGGTANATASGIDECHRSTDEDANPGNGPRVLNGSAPSVLWPNPHPGAIFGHLPYSNEGDIVNSAAKVNTWPMSTIFLGRDPFETGLGVSAYDVAGRGTPHDLGLRQSGAVGRGLWFATPNTVWSPDRPDIGEPIEFYTYYAFVSPAVVAKHGLTLPNGGATGTYGAENCGTATTGIRLGWDCDKSHWYRDASGGDAQPRSTSLGPGPTGTGVSYAVFVGALYQLRDVDCHDQSVKPARSMGVSWGTLTGTSC